VEEAKEEAESIVTGRAVLTALLEEYGACGGLVDGGHPGASPVLMDCLFAGESRGKQSESVTGHEENRLFSAVGIGAGD